MKAFLFDFDGLLCDTEHAARSSWAELYHRLGTEFPETVWRRMIGRSDGHTVAATHLAAVLGRPVTEEELAWRLRRKGELADLEPLRPGSAELLTRIADRGYALAVVSSSAAPWVVGHLRRLGVADRFVHVVTGDVVTGAGPLRHKPAPDLYLHALRLLGVDQEEAVAFEDSPTGVRAAHAAGLRCVLVSTRAEDGDLTGATYTVASLADVDLDVLTGPS